MTGAGLIQDTLLRAGLMSFLLIGPLEELSKLAAVWLAVYRRPDFREPLDGIIYSSTAAIGFASVENIVYLGYLGPGILISRALFATPAHVMFSSMWGYSLGVARFRREGELLTVAKGLLVSALLHGTVQFPGSSPPQDSNAVLAASHDLHGMAHESQDARFQASPAFP